MIRTLATLSSLTAPCRLTGFARDVAMAALCRS